MPLFMDRHDVPGVTAEQVAQAHLADLDMGAKFGVQFLAYWFDADQGEAFCLAKAPTGDSLTAVHKATHGLIPNEIISVSEENVLRLLGRMSETGGETRAVNPFRTILFTDLQSSTSARTRAVGPPSSKRSTASSHRRAVIRKTFWGFATTVAATSDALRHQLFGAWATRTCSCSIAKPTLE